MIFLCWFLARKSNIFWPTIKTVHIRTDFNTHPLPYFKPKTINWFQDVALSEHKILSSFKFQVLHWNQTKINGGAPMPSWIAKSVANFSFCNTVGLTLNYWYYHQCLWGVGFLGGTNFVDSPTRLFQMVNFVLALIVDPIVSSMKNWSIGKLTKRETILKWCVYQKFGFCTK